MPRIPIYNEPQVQAQGVQGGMQPQMKSNAAEAVGLAGQAAQIGLQAKEQSDTLRAEDAFNKLQEQKTQLWGDASQKLGENGLNVHDEYTKQYDQKVQEIVGTMGAGAAFKFQQAAARGRLAFSAELEHHQIQQSEALARNVVEMGHKQDIDEAGTTVLPDVAAQRANHTAFLAGVEADRQGLKDDPAKGVMARQEFIKSMTSKVHLSYLAGALDRNPAEAENYLNQHQNEMLGADYHTAKEHIDVANAFSLGQSVAQENVEPFTGDEDKKDGIPESAILGNIMQDARLQKNPKAMSQAIAVAKELIATQRADWKEQANRHIAAVYDVSNQKGPGAALRSREMRILQAVDPIEADAAKNHLLGEIDASRARSESDPMAQVARYATYQKFLDDPAKLINMSDSQIVACTGSLGPQLAKDLLKAKRTAAGNLDSLKANTLNDLPFKDIAAEYGLKVKGTMTRQDNAKLGLLRDKVLEAVRAEQVASGKPMGVDRKKEILRNQLTNVSVNQPGWWLGLMDGTTEKPLFQVENFMDLKASDEEKTAAIAYLVQAEAPVNPANVQTMIDAIRAKKAGK